jgi:M6 family metalloprotease-like protein
MKRLVVVFIIFLISPAYGAPHITGAKKEPLVMIGEHIRTRLSKGLLSMHLAPSSYPASVRILLLRVEFQQENPDDPGTTGDGTWQWCKSSTGCPNDDPDYWVNNAKQTFINYWKEVSYNKLNVTIDVSPKIYTLPGKMADYGSEGFSALDNLIYDSVSLADNDIDFSQYDVLLIVHAGAGEETDSNSDTPMDLWSLYYWHSCIRKNNSGPCLKADGRDITEAIIMPQTDTQDGIVVNPVGVYLHEFGHWLGLPDLYCTAQICLLDGVGVWSLMDTGTYNPDPSKCNNNYCEYGSSPAHLDAWSKVYLGWVIPEELPPPSDPGQKTLYPVETSPQVLKLQAVSSTGQQYFLLENRQGIGFDKGLPGSGLLVWLIDQDVIDQNLKGNSINNSRWRPGVKLIEADGEFNLLNSSDGDLGSSSDPFPGSLNKKVLSPVTSPSSQGYSEFAWVNLRDISESQGNIILNIGYGPLPPSNLSISGQTLSWQQNPSDTTGPAIKYRIYKNGSLLHETDLTSYTDQASISGDIYFVTALDPNGNESSQSNQVVSTYQPPKSSGGGGGCFIATSAYGSPLHPYVKVLREFRDKYLMTNSPGRAFVRLYYRYSPPVAELIKEYPFLKYPVRLLIITLVFLIKFPWILLLLLPSGIFIALKVLRE